MNQRNRDIVEARASGRPVQAIALEHGLSVARVSRICSDHRKDLRIAELERENDRLFRSNAQLASLVKSLDRQVNRDGLGAAV